MPTPTGFSTAEVARLVRVSPQRVRSWVRAGFVTPRRGAGRRLLFSFQQVVVLRAARELVAAEIPPRRVGRILGRLRRQLPRGRPLASMRIGVDGQRVVVRQGSESWVAESGQLLLDFETAPLARRALPMARRVAADAQRHAGELSAEDWYELGYELEATVPEEAVTAYRAAVELDPAHADAHVNLGRLLHEAGEIQAAEEHYRRAIGAQPTDPTAAYDLGVALQDLGRLDEAVRAYRRAVELDAGYADAYFNLAAVYERLGREALAIRHLKTYRHLTVGG